MEEARREEARRAVATERRTTPTRRQASRKAKPPKKRKIELAKPKEPSTFWGKVKAGYQKTESTVAKYTTKPVAKALKAVGLSKERVGKYAVKGFGAGAAKRAWEKVEEKQGYRPSYAPSKADLRLQQESQKGFVSGVATGLQTKPVKTGLVAAATYVFPKVTAYAGLGAAKVAPAAYLKTAPALAATGKVASGVLAGSYLYQRGKQAAAIPPGRARGEFVGEVTATEVAPGLTGGFFGGRAATSVREKATVIATAKTQLTPKQQTEFFKTLELAKTAKGKISKVYKAPIEQVLPKKEAAVTRSWLAGKGKKAIVYGSVAQKTQVTGKTLKQMRPSGDIDIAVKYPHRAAIDYSTAIYKATGVKPTIPMKALARGGAFGPGREASVFVKGKAVTFHTTTSLEASPFYLGKPRKTPGGVYVQRIEEQLGRKVAGAMIRGRAKDIPDYKQISKSVASQLKRQAPFRIRKGLAEARIKGFEKVGKLPKIPKASAGKAYAYQKYPTSTPAYPVPTSPYKTPAYSGKYGLPAQKYPVPFQRTSYRPPTPPYRPPTPPYRPPSTPPYRPPGRPGPPPFPYRRPDPYMPGPPPGRPLTQYVPRRRGRIKGRRRAPFKRYKQTKLYTPTLRAAAFGIKAKKAPKKLTGLEERGIL